MAGASEVFSGPSYSQCDYDERHCIIIELLVPRHILSFQSLVIGGEQGHDYCFRRCSVTIPLPLRRAVLLWRRLHVLTFNSKMLLVWSGLVGALRSAFLDELFESNPLLSVSMDCPPRHVSQ